MAAEPVIQLRDITKRFPGVVANDGVTVEVGRGEIHAVVGENGAGKSTLMKILYGLYRPDAGEILIRGRPVALDGPRHALHLGIGMVHQHFMLVPGFTVTENIILGSEPASHGRLDRARARAVVARLCQQFGFRLDPDAQVQTLSVGEQQRIEILKVLYRGAEILILDEPTAVLVPQEVEELFTNLRRLRADGKTILFISHKLDEVLAIADRITVLRRGRVVGTVAAGATKAALAEMMVGRPVLLALERSPAAPGELMLEAQDLTVADGDGRALVRGVSLAVRGGEIYAIAGVEGNGQSELVEALVGLRPLAGGRVLVGGAPVARHTVREARSRGVAHVPEDRHRRGLVLPMAVWENLILGHHRRRSFLRGPFLRMPAILEFGRQRVAEFDVRVPALRTPALALSGGNQQKLVLARELAFQPRVLIAAQPTRGLDIGATEFVRRQLLAARAEGRAVLLVSADLDEVLTLADRIGVMYNGRIAAEFAHGEATPAELGLYMVGTERKGREGAP